ncbi:MAG: hypothetical protein ACP5JU_02470 [Minisyncoccia bacterium]
MEDMKIKKRKNVELIFRDVFDENIIKAVEKYDIIFSDPARLRKTEVEYSKKTLCGICIELSSMIKLY